MRYHSQDREDRIIKLLQNWTLIVERLGNKKRAAMLSLQLTIYKDPFQWNAVLNEFKKLMNSSFSGNAETLLGQWQNFIANKSVVSYSDSHDKLCDSWIHWLIETELEDRKDKYWFSDKVKKWLFAVKELNPKAYDEIIRKWKIDHKRRINFWKAVK